MTGQEIFSRIWEYSKTMLFPAIGVSDLCRYQTEGGDRCFIGSLIPDEHPALLFSDSVVPLAYNYPDLPFADWVLENTARASTMQGIHDSMFYGYQVPE